MNYTNPDATLDWLSGHRNSDNCQNEEQVCVMTTGCASSGGDVDEDSTCDDSDTCIDTDEDSKCERTGDSGGV